MNDKSQLKKFITFLKKEHIYEIYLRNLTSGSEYRQRYAMIKETVKSCPHNLIVDAFRWSSRDGVNWVRINEKWEYIIGYRHRPRYI